MISSQGYKAREVLWPLILIIIIMRHVASRFVDSVHETVLQVVGALEVPGTVENYGVGCYCSGLNHGKARRSHRQTLFVYLGRLYRAVAFCLYTVLSPVFRIPRHNERALLL